MQKSERGKKEPEIGDIVMSEGIRFKTVEVENGCNNCDLYAKEGCGKFECFAYFRFDGNNVIFKEVKKQTK